MVNLLMISPYAPYDSIPHAGGKSNNYYFKRICGDNNFNVKLITFAKEEEKKYIENDNYKFDIDVEYFINSKLIKKNLRRLNNINIYNPFDKYGGFRPNFIKNSVIKRINKLKEQGYTPEVIILEWTQIVLMENIVKRVFPNAKIIAIEHDVSFLGLKRKIDYEKTNLKKIIGKLRYKNLYSAEIKALEKCDLVLTLNYKDYELLKSTKVNLNLIDYFSPYYFNLQGITPELEGYNIVFFGAMDRIENYTSCLWFIDNVFNKLLEKNSEFKFYAVGNKPPQVLKDRESSNIIVTGYVNNIETYFQKSLCVVAPLQLGAGIKIKILESMSAGAVVLTNNVGIEGIPVIDRVHYLHCEEPNDYINTILDITNNRYDIRKISNNAKKYITEKFNINESYNKLSSHIIKIKSNR